MVTYGLSMFFGFLGADRFYLGDNGGGVMKLSTFGGFGTWWVYDIIRTGSAPVDTGNFKVAADLPHYAFVLSCTMWGITLGFVLAYHLTRKFRSRRRREAMMLQLDEEARQQEPAKQFTDFYGPGIDKPVIQNYGSMKPGMNPSMDRYDPFSAPNGPPTMSFNGPQTMPPGSFQ
jgi:TM2 domain-containing membrane protein YozV